MKFSIKKGQPYSAIVIFCENAFLAIIQPYNSGTEGKINVGAHLDCGDCTDLEMIPWNHTCQ